MAVKYDLQSWYRVPNQHGGGDYARSRFRVPNRQVAIIIQLHLSEGELLGHPRVCQSSPTSLYRTVSRDLREMGGYL